MSMEPAATYGAPPSTTSSYDPVNTWDGNGPYSRVWMPTNGVEAQNLAYSYYSPGSSSSSYNSVGSSSSSSSSSSSTNYNWTRSNVPLTTHRSIVRCCPRKRIPDRTSANKIRPKKRTPNNQVACWRSTSVSSSKTVGDYAGYNCRIVFNKTRIELDEFISLSRN